MPYSPNCDSQVKEEDKFCDKCGTQLSNKPVEKAYFHFPPKLSTNRLNGIVIGSGITLLILGLLGVFALNSYYWEQARILSAQGLPTNTYNPSLNPIIEFISLSWASVFFGIYFLALCLPSQFSPLVRAVWARTDYTARAGNGSITGGFVFATLSATQAIREFYVPDHTWYRQALQILIVSGVLIIVIGASLRTLSYLRRRKLATKV